jgi:hypothetical protein
LRVGWCALVVIVSALVIAIRIRLLGIPLERDEGEHAYAGQLMLQGIPASKFAYNMKFPGTYAAYAVINDSGRTSGLGSCHRFLIFWTSRENSARERPELLWKCRMRQDRGQRPKAIFRLVGVNPTLQTRAAVLVQTLRGTLKRISQSAMPVFVLENR